LLGSKSSISLFLLEGISREVSVIIQQGLASCGSDRQMGDKYVSVTCPEPSRKQQEGGSVEPERTHQPEHQKEPVVTKRKVAGDQNQ
jgi:hypothetical protein